MASSASNRLTDGVSKLSVNAGARPKTPKSTTTAAVADSWEDEEADAEADSRPVTAGYDTAAEGTTAPPPTPSNPGLARDRDFSLGSNRGGITPSSSAASSLTFTPSAGRDERLQDLGDTSSAPARQEKTDAVARRMIAAGLGLKAPKLTDEQKAYDRAVRENERKRKEAVREAERRRAEEAERAKVAIWED